MKPILSCLTLVLSACAFEARAAAATPPLKAVGMVELKDAAGDMGPIGTSAGEEPPLDVVLLDVKSGSGRLDLVATLAGPPGSFATSPIRLYIDVDNNPATGIKMFGGGPTGFEYVAELDMCINYSDGSVACHGGASKAKPTSRYAAVELKRFKGESEYENDTVVDAMGFPGSKAAVQTPVTGNVVAAGVELADLKLKPGQTIRLLPKEAGGNPKDGDGYFPIVLLTLK